MNPPDQLTLPFDLPDVPPKEVPLAVPDAGETIPAPLTICPPLLPQGAKWREVLARSGQSIGFVLQRSKRKTIGLVVGDDGLRITAPKWVTLRQIDDTVLEKSAWILDKLAQHRARQEQLALADTQWREGGRFPYLGRQVMLMLGSPRGQTSYEGDIASPRSGDVLHLALPNSADRNRVRDSTQSWLQQRARSWFGLRLVHFQETSGLTVNRWRLSSAATRWGSCNSDGNIMLNWRLIHFDPAIIDYVIAHEIAHLREMNHGPDFWREVGRILPGFEAARNTLRQHDPATLPLL